MYAKHSILYLYPRLPNFCDLLPYIAHDVSSSQTLRGGWMQYFHWGFNFRNHHGMHTFAISGTKARMLDHSGDSRWLWNDRNPWDGSTETGRGCGFQQSLTCRKAASVMSGQAWGPVCVRGRVPPFWSSWNSNILNRECQDKIAPWLNCFLRYFTFVKQVWSNSYKVMHTHTHTYLSRTIQKS